MQKINYFLVAVFALVLLPITPAYSGQPANKKIQASFSRNVLSISGIDSGGGNLIVRLNSKKTVKINYNSTCSSSNCSARINLSNRKNVANIIKQNKNFYLTSYRYANVVEMLTHLDELITDLYVGPSDNVYLESGGVSKISSSGLVENSWALKNFTKTARHQGMVQDSKNNLYVLSTQYTGRLKGKTSISKIAPNKRVYTRWLSGNQYTGFREDIAIDSQDNLYISDWSNKRIIKIWSGGAINYNWARTKNRPFDIELDSNGNVYTLESTPQGRQTYVGRVKPASNGTVYSVWSQPISKGVSKMQIDSQNNIYTIHPEYSSVTKVFGSTGESVIDWAKTETWPLDFTIDKEDNLYVVDGIWGATPFLYDNSASETITKISPSGLVDTNWANIAYIPEFIDSDSEGNIYVKGGDFSITKVTPSSKTISSREVSFYTCKKSKNVINTTCRFNRIGVE